MKKLLFSLAVALAGLTASALDWQSSDYLAGPYVIISNNATVFYCATNVVYANPQTFYEKLSFSTNYNSGTITNGAVLNGVSYSTNFTPYVAGQLAPPAGYIYPLLSMTNHLSTTNQPLNGQAWNDCYLWPDRNGNVVTSCALHVALNTDPYRVTSGGPTNTADFEFRKIVGFIPVPGIPGAKYPLVATDTSANDLLLFRLAVGGQTNAVFSTNLTTGQIQGAYGWRLTKVVSGNSTTNAEPISGATSIAFFLMDIGLDGFNP